MDKAKIVTTIQQPTSALAGHVDESAWRLYVVGDRKTPRDWSMPGATYLGVPEQEALPFRICETLPWNHYCRKMVGYLAAIRDGAAAIYETDDDNLPLSNWHVPPFEGRYSCVEDGAGFVNVYSHYTDMRVWPRGFPLSKVADRSCRVDSGRLATEAVQVGVWQGLANGDPDVDAVYRLTSNQGCTFDDAGPLVLGVGTYCPFNSQNTFYAQGAFPLLYLPSFVTFRFTDILRGLVAQPILHAGGMRLGFIDATVVQERNPHDYMKDFRDEIPMYLQSERVPAIAAGALDPNSKVGANLVAVYDALRAADVVPREETELVRRWVEDVEELTAVFRPCQSPSSTHRP